MEGRTPQAMEILQKIMQETTMMTRAAAKCLKTILEVMVLIQATEVILAAVEPVTRLLPTEAIAEMDRTEALMPTEATVEMVTRLIPTEETAGTDRMKALILENSI